MQPHVKLKCKIEKTGETSPLFETLAKLKPLGSRGNLVIRILTFHFSAVIDVFTNNKTGGLSNIISGFTESMSLVF